MQANTRLMIVAAVFLALVAVGVFALVLLQARPEDESVAVPERKGEAETEGANTPPPVPEDGPGPSSPEGKDGAPPAEPAPGDGTVPPAGDQPGDASSPEAETAVLITGTVFDGRTRDPVEGASARWMPAGVSPETGRSHPGAVTDAGGTFRITIHAGAETPPGTRGRVVVEAAGFKTTSVDPVVLPADRADLGAIWLEEGPLLSGTVLGRDNAPVEGARVRITEDAAFRLEIGMDYAELFEMIGRPDRVFARTFSMAGGRFAFETGDMESGAYAVRVEAPGHATALVHDVTIPAAKPLTIVLKEPAAASGRVETTAASPVGDAQVVAVVEPESPGAINQTFNLDKFWTRTGADGSFRLEGLPSGNFMFLVTAEGLPVTARQSVRIPAEEEIVIRIETGFSLSGTVVDGATGRAVAGARIRMISNAGGGFSAAESGEDGRYRLDNLAPGHYQVAIDADGYSTSMKRVEGKPGEAIQKDFRIQKGVTVSGRVVDAETGEGVPGASVTPLDPSIFLGGKTGVVSGPDGRFTLEGISPAGFGAVEGEEGPSSSRIPVPLIVQKSGWEPAQSLVEIPAGNDSLSDVEVKLIRLHVVTGRVVDGKGAPVSGAEIRVLGTDPVGFPFLADPEEEDEPIRSDAQGRFQASFSFGDGLLVRHPSYAWHVHVVEEAPFLKGGSEVIVRLQRGGTLAGIVLNEDGEPLVGEPVRFRPAGRKEVSPHLSSGLDRVLPTVSTDGRGRFVSSKLEAGPWTVSIRKGKHSETAEVTEGGTSHVTLRAASLLSISGTVVDVSGAPVEGAHVYAMIRSTEDGSDMWTESAVSGPDGAFTIEQLTAETYDVRAWDHNTGKNGHVENVPAGSVGVRVVLERE